MLPIIGVAAIVFDGPRFVLIQRGRPPLAGFWSIPGGKVELGEPLETAIRREIKEECGLELADLTLLTTVDLIEHDQAAELLFHYVLIEYTATAAAGTAIAGDDAQSLGWFTFDEALKLELVAETERVLRLAHAQRGLPIAMPAPQADEGAARRA